MWFGRAKWDVTRADLGLFEPESLVSEVGRSSPNTSFELSLGVVQTDANLGIGVLKLEPCATFGFSLASGVGLNPRGGVNFHIPCVGSSANLGLVLRCDSNA